MVNDATLPTVDGSGPPPSVDPSASTQAGARYEVLDYLGHGGMSVVFRARDRLTGDLVALKQMSDVVRGRDDGDETAQRRRLTLAREFNTLASLRHPNIIAVRDYGFAANGEPFFTMELIDRPRDLLTAGSGLDGERRVDLLIQLLRALSYLHRRGVIHRDLKPSNVLVDDQVRVLDFGIASRRGESAVEAGTLGYIAPEILGGAAPTEMADLYAVGMLAYELFAGVHPFRGLDAPSLRQAVLSREPDVERLQVGAELRAIIRRCLAKEPGERFESADALAEALAAAAGHSAPWETPATRESFLLAADFVDRVEERRVLKGALDDVLAGKGSAWLVAGESGIGKTRLLDEVRTQALVAGVQVFTGHGSGEQREPFELWRGPLRHLALSTEPQGAQVRALSALLPELAAKPGGEAAPGLGPGGGQSARTELLATILAMLEGQGGPVLLLLEDLQWAGEGLTLLGELLPDLSGLPVFVLASYRSEERPDLDQVLPGAQVLRLRPIGGGDIATLAGSMLGRDRERPAVVEFLERHTEGNLFFLVEAVRALAEEAGSLDAIRAETLPERLVSQGISAVVARRLAKIPAHAEPVFAWSALRGRTLDVASLERVFGADRVADTLALGQELALLEVREERWRFAHDKFREHVVDGLDLARSQGIHAEIARTVESVHGGGKPLAATLAHHYREAGLSEQELEYTALAGQVALEQGAYADATRLLERALALNTSEPTGTPSRELDLRLLYGSVLGATQSWSAPAYERTYDRVVELTRALGRHEQLIPALHGLAMFHGFRGDLKKGHDLALQYGQLADEIDDRCGSLQAAVVLANACTWRGDHGAAEVHHRRVIELYEPAELPLYMSRYGWDPRIVAAVTHAASTCICGHADRALAMVDEAMALADASGHPFGRAIAEQLGAWVHLLRREVPETLAYGERLGALARENGFPVFTMLADVFVGWAKVLTGDHPRGLALLRAAVDAQQAVGGVARSFNIVQFADAYLIAGRDEEARAELRAILDDSTLQERCYHAELLRLSAEGWRRAGEPKRAEAALSEALALAKSQQAVLFEGRTRADYARLRAR